MTTICPKCNSDDYEEDDPDMWLCNECGHIWDFDIVDRLYSELYTLEGIKAEWYSVALNEFLAARQRIGL